MNPDAVNNLAATSNAKEETAHAAPKRKNKIPSVFHDADDSDTSGSDNEKEPKDVHIVETTKFTESKLNKDDMELLQRLKWGLGIINADVRRKQKELEKVPTTEEEEEKGSDKEAANGDDEEKEDHGLDPTDQKSLVEEIDELAAKEKIEDEEYREKVRQIYGEPVSLSADQKWQVMFPSIYVTVSCSASSSSSHLLSLISSDYEFIGRTNQEEAQRVEATGLHFRVAQADGNL